MGSQKFDRFPWIDIWKRLELCGWADPMDLSCWTGTIFFENPPKTCENHCFGRFSQIWRTPPPWWVSQSSQPRRFYHIHTSTGAGATHYHHTTHPTYDILCLNIAIFMIFNWFSVFWELIYLRNYNGILKIIDTEVMDWFFRQKWIVLWVFITLYRAGDRRTRFQHVDFLELLYKSSGWLRISYCG